MNLSTSKYGHLKYTLGFAEIQAAAGGDITLDTLPPGTVVTAVWIKPTVALSGGTVSAATLAPKIGGNAVGSAVNIFTATGAINTNAGVAGSLTAANALVVTVAVTGTGATAGSVDVIVDYKVMAA